MKHRKIAPVLLLTSATLLLVACLPGIVGGCMDLLTLGKPDEAPIGHVELELGSQEEMDPGRMFQKLALERNMQLIPVTNREATMTKEQVFSAVEEQMGAYDFFQWFDYTQRTAEPHLAMDPEDSDNYAIIWAVDYASKEPYHNLFLHVDDATGAILKIDYYTHEELYPAQEQRHIFENWTNSYFERLGLGMDSAYVRSLDVTWTQQSSEKDSLRVNCYMQEIQYGLVTVSFTVKPGGFYISFSGSQEGMQWEK